MRSRLGLGIVLHLPLRALEFTSEVLKEGRMLGLIGSALVFFHSFQFLQRFRPEPRYRMEGRPCSTSGKKGDWIEAGGTLGMETDIFLAATRVRTRDNIEYLFPMPT